LGASAFGRGRGSDRYIAAEDSPTTATAAYTHAASMMSNATPGSVGPTIEVSSWKLEPTVRTLELVALDDNGSSAELAGDQLERSLSSRTREVTGSAVSGRDLTRGVHVRVELAADGGPQTVFNWSAVMQR
jgi:hypothetical protein